MTLEQDLERAAEAVRKASALVITAGAGMGVDSGLPDFRGPEGFWRAYPPYKDLGLAFEDLADPRWFAEDPALAWGFYGHRLELYRRTTPHAGFQVLRRWAEQTADGWFVFTSNVDGAFQRAGFDPERVVECHGAIDYAQCTRCDAAVARCEARVEVDPATFRAEEPLPRCPCGALLRPNVLMFGDWGWEGGRTHDQQVRLDRWWNGLPGSARVVVVECGAGTAIPSVRHFSERVARQGGTLVRINVREAQVPPGQVGLPLGAREALERIDALLRP